MLTEQFFSISHAAHEVILWFLIALSVISIAIMLERFFFLYAFRNETAIILRDMREALDSGRNTHMKLVYDRHGLKSTGTLLREAWEHILHQRDQGLEEVLDSYLLSLKPQLEKSLGVLATMGSNAPFIGLLGTIFGVMESFHALGTGSGSMEMVMTGIAKALVATAVGLIVAIPAITAYNYLQKQLQVIFFHLSSMKEAAIAFAKFAEIPSAGEEQDTK